MEKLSDNYCVCRPEERGAVEARSLAVPGGGAGVEGGVPARHQAAALPAGDLEDEVTLHVGESVGPVVLQLHRLPHLDITINMVTGYFLFI